MKEIKLIPRFLDCENHLTYELSVLIEDTKPYYELIKRDIRPICYEAV